MLFGFYSVVGGWIIIYIAQVAMQLFGLGSGSLADIHFDQVISNPVYTITGQGIFILITMVIVMLGVEHGLEKHPK